MQIFFRKSAFLSLCKIVWRCHAADKTPIKPRQNLDMISVKKKDCREAVLRKVSGLDLLSLFNGSLSGNFLSGNFCSLSFLAASLLLFAALFLFAALRFLAALFLLAALVVSFLAATHCAESDGCNQHQFFHTETNFYVVILCLIPSKDRNRMQNYAIFWIYAKKIVILHEIFELYGKKYKKGRLFGYKTRFYNA